MVGVLPVATVPNIYPHLIATHSIYLWSDPCTVLLQTCSAAYFICKKFEGYIMHSCKGHNRGMTLQGKNVQQFHLLRYSLSP